MEGGGRTVNQQGLEGQDSHADGMVSLGHEIQNCDGVDLGRSRMAY